MSVYVLGARFPLGSIRVRFSYVASRASSISIYSRSHTTPLLSCVLPWKASAVHSVSSSVTLGRVTLFVDHLSAINSTPVPLKDLVLSQVRSHKQLFTTSVRFFAKTGFSLVLYVHIALLSFPFVVSPSSVRLTPRFLSHSISGSSLSILVFTKLLSPVFSRRSLRRPRCSSNYLFYIYVRTVINYPLNPNFVNYSFRRVILI